MTQKIEDAKELILSEGKRILLEEGYKALSLRRLAVNCGLGLGTFYNYFDNKQQLTKEIFNNDWHHIVELVDSLIASGESFKLKLDIIYRAIEEFVHTYYAVFLEISQSEGSENRDKNIINQVHNKMVELIRFEIENGTINPAASPEKMAYLIINNFIYISRDSYMTVDEFYSCLDLGNKH